MTAATAELVGGRYEIVRTLGQGAFGHTFLARDRQTDRTVAIKLLDTRGRPDHKAYELFKREAEVLRAIRHHGIPEVYDTLQDSWYGAPAAFLVMEYIEGTSLAQIIEEKRAMDGGDVVHLFLELLGILDYLHTRVPPILHRDIKPSNILLRPNGFPALVDFGSVRRVFLTAEESGSTVAGTYGYMPYEQYMGQATPSSDLYATAATFLHLLTARAPREFMTEEGRIEVPETLPGEQRLRPVIARLLRSSPAERFASARDVRNALVGAPESRAITKQASGRRSGVQRLSKTVELVQSLPPAPRELKGETRKLMQDSTFDTVRVMTASTKSLEDWGAFDVVTLVFFSVITVGIMPLIFFSIANARRRRMRRFFRDGHPGIGEITRIELETTAFDEKLARVAYQFEADGESHRDSDVVLPTIADRLQPGDQVPILYLPDRDYDSVIVAVE
jgi:serine/threonine protein kinase